MTIFHVIYAHRIYLLETTHLHRPVLCLLSRAYAPLSLAPAFAEHPGGRPRLRGIDDTYKCGNSRVVRGLRGPLSGFCPFRGFRFLRSFYLLCDSKPLAEAKVAVANRLPVAPGITPLLLRTQVELATVFQVATIHSLSSLGSITSNLVCSYC